MPIKKSERNNIVVEVFDVSDSVLSKDNEELVSNLRNLNDRYIKIRFERQTYCIRGALGFTFSNSLTFPNIFLYSIHNQ